MSSVQHTASMEVVFDTKAEDVIMFLNAAPADAKVRVESSPYYNQFDRGYSRIKVTWND